MSNSTDVECDVNLGLLGGKLRASEAEFTNQLTNALVYQRLALPSTSKLQGGKEQRLAQRSELSLSSFIDPKRRTAGPAALYFVFCKVVGIALLMSFD